MPHRNKPKETTRQIPAVWLARSAGPGEAEVKGPPKENSNGSGGQSGSPGVLWMQVYEKEKEHNLAFHLK